MPRTPWRRWGRGHRAGHTIHPAPTGVTAFVGQTHGGPTATPVVLRSAAELPARFGVGHGPLDQAVADFFTHGGEEAVVVRVDTSERSSTAARIAALGALSTASFDLLVLPPDALDVPVDVAVVDAALEAARAARAILVLDPPPSWRTADDAIAGAALLTHSPDAAMWFPPFNTVDPVVSRLRLPAGAVAGIIARTDRTRGVWAAPAGAHALADSSLVPAVPMSEMVATKVADVAINPIATHVSVGTVLWGSRTRASATSTETEETYLSVRRLHLHLRTSIEQGTGWAREQPNAAPLWTELRTRVEELLHGLDERGAFAGDQPEESWFVRCGEDTMSADAIASGRATVLVGYAPIRPSEFVLLRVGVEATPP